MTINDTTLRMERVFNTTPEKLYKAWTDPGQLVQWWGPEGFTVPVHDINAKVGGSYRTTMAAPDGSEHTVSGVFKELVPNC